MTVVPPAEPWPGDLGPCETWPMRLHIQNPPDETAFRITPAQWRAALDRVPLDRAPGMGEVRVSIADGDAGFREAMREAEVLVTWTGEARRLLPAGALPAAAPRLRVISFTSAGLDRLAPFDWVPDGVAILNNRGTHAEKAGEFGIMAILMLRNGLTWFAHDARAGHWAPRYGATLAGATLGVLGLGSLGGGIAARARQFGMRVLGVRGTARPHEHCDEVFGEDALDAVLPRLDFLAIACPLTERTRGMVSRGRLAALPRGAGVVNVARGEVWDQEAACDLLDAGHLGGCVTDVAVPEPLPADSRLWRTPGMFVTPHMSSDDPTTYNERTLDILLENLGALRAGRAMPNRVDTARGY